MYEPIDSMGVVVQSQGTVEGTDGSANFFPAVFFLLGSRFRKDGWRAGGTSRRGPTFQDAIE